MARSRNIKPGFFKNDLLADMPFEYRLLFVGLWTLADREGRLEDRPKRIRMEIFPADDVNVDDALNTLQDSGFITRYEVEGYKCIQIEKFMIHQNPHHMETPSVIPPKEGEVNKFNSTPISPKQRARIYARDGNKCVWCESEHKLQIDHIIRRIDGGTSEDDNLRTLCKQCNLKRGKKPEKEINPADSLIPDSLKLIPDSQIPDTRFPVDKNIMELQDANSVDNEQDSVDNDPVPVDKSVNKKVSEKVGFIFEYWKATLEHHKALLDGKTERLISNAYKLGYSKEDLCRAIEGCSRSPFHMGMNDRHTRYDGLSLILRDAENIARFIGYANFGQAAQTVGGVVLDRGGGDTRMRSIGEDLMNTDWAKGYVKQTQEGDTDEDRL